MIKKFISIILAATMLLTCSPLFAFADSTGTNSQQTSTQKKEFVIENGVLTKYKGAGGDVDIPDDVTKYLKKSGVFIFSWDNPLMQCIEAEGNKYTISKSYLDEATIDLAKGNQAMKLKNWKLSSYINELASAGFKIDKLIEETDKDILNQEHDFTLKYYSKHKAKLINTSFIIKAIKL